jgi:co-chaperonin GroES (HSP10)
MEVIDKRSIEGAKPEPPEVHGSVHGFIPAGDYVLIRRLEAQTEESGIIRPEAYVELAERGVVIATSRKAANEIPLDATAKFSKYGAEEIHFDDEGQSRYVLVRMSDVRGWHLAS